MQSADRARRDSGAALAAIAAIAAQESAVAAVAAIATSGAIAAIATDAESPGVTTMAAVACLTDTLLGRGTAVARDSAVPARITAVATLGAVAAIADKQAGVAAVARLAFGTGRIVVGEAVASEQAGVRVVGGAITKEHVLACLGLLSDAIDRAIDATGLRRPRLVDGAQEGPGHVDGLLDALGHALSGRSRCG